jgi:anti-anti-sigma factor
MTPLAHLRVDWHDDTPVAALEGEVDASNAEAISLAVRALVSNRSIGLIVDLSPTRYLDSAGINLLFALAEELRSRQLELRIVVAPASPIARMLAITSLDRAVSTYDAVEDALAAS